MKNITSSLKYFLVQKLKISNKEAIKYIIGGRVLVNKMKGQPNQLLQPEDEVQLDTQVIKVGKEYIYLAYYKPRGIESTLNTQIENNLVQALNLTPGIFPVGRLDKESEGLMLLTNHGDFLNKIIHAEKNQEKEYLVTVDKPLTPVAINMLETGIEIMGQKTRPAIIKQIKENTFRIILSQGRNRQIRRMCYKLDYQVQRLIRLRIISLHLQNLLPGQWRHLSETELAELHFHLSD
jgi:23S rRNA pseudouridine2604 synthase